MDQAEVQDVADSTEMARVEVGIMEPRAIKMIKESTEVRKPVENISGCCT